MEKSKNKILKIKVVKYLVFAFCIFIFAFFMSSCGYKLQTKADLPFESISMGKIENKTHELKIQDKLNKILTETLMEYGFRVSPAARYRIEVDITRFDLNVLSEIGLTAAEYQVSIIGKFRLIDIEKGTSTPLMDLNSPFVTYFSSLGKLVNVIAQKEMATNSALKDLSQELVRRNNIRHLRQMADGNRK